MNTELRNAMILHKNFNLNTVNSREEARRICKVSASAHVAEHL
jgi:hypothetical protein